MTSVVVLVPVLNRPHAARPLVDSLRSSCDARLLFIVQKYDRAERKACDEAARAHDGVTVEVVRFEHAAGDYARKVNRGVNITEEDWIFQGADDLRFQRGWLEEALAVADRSRARVIGTNDKCNPRVMRGGHSTHSLVHRSYVEDVGTVDEPGRMLHEGYWHNFCDDELVMAAKMRGEFQAARRSVVEHLHPNCADVAVDATYMRGLDKQRFMADRRLYNLRRTRVMRRRPVIGEARR